MVLYFFNKKLALVVSLIANFWSQFLKDLFYKIPSTFCSIRVIEVIARLPFDNPKDPFYQKIESWFSKQGKSTFDSYSLPMTVLRFKQAIGRAQRRPEQRSAILLMDNRPLVKSYGKLFLKEVTQEVALKHAKFEEVKEDIQDFLEQESQLFKTNLF